ELLILENDLRERLVRCMRDAHRDTLHAQRLGNFFRFALQRQCGPSTFHPHHLHVHPAHPAAPAGPQRLHGRFFHGEAPRIPFIFVLELFAVRHFVWRVHAPQKPFPLRLNHFLDALHFRHVNAQPNDHRSPNCGATRLRCLDPIILSGPCRDGNHPRKSPQTANAASRARFLSRRRGSCAVPAACKSFSSLPFANSPGWSTDSARGPAASANSLASRCSISASWNGTRAKTSRKTATSCKPRSTLGVSRWRRSSKSTPT